MQEREQKRQYATSGNILRDGLAWTYTLLGGDKKQLATYNGVEGEFCGQNAVWMWPVEHNSYGPAQTRIITRPNGFKEFVIPDHLGSSRLTISAEGDVLQRSDYEPFGSSLANEGVGSRTSYIGREEDGESGLGFYGVRLYEPEYGRFTSVDPLWEQYVSFTPYHYALNQPTGLVDHNGEEVFITSADGSEKFKFDGENLINEDGTLYSGNDEWVLTMKTALVNLLGMGGDPARDILTAISTTDGRDVTYVLDADPQTQTGNATLPDIDDGIGRGVELATSLGTGVNTKVYIDPNKMSPDPNMFLATIGHENRHAYHLITGTRNDDSERQALSGENAVRSVLGMPMRTNYGLHNYDYKDVVPWWVKPK